MDYIDERGETWHIEQHGAVWEASPIKGGWCVHGSNFDTVVEAIGEYVADECAKETEDRKDEAETLRLETQRRQWDMGTRNTKA